MFIKMNLLSILIIFSLIPKQLWCQKSIINNKSLSTSIAGLEFLLEIEQNLVKNLESYANALENKLTILRRAISEIYFEIKKYQLGSEEYLANPLNSYSLIRRMCKDWLHWERFLEQKMGTVEVDTIRKYRSQVSSTDLDEAAAAIYRLQVTYDLKPNEMAAGLLNGRQYDAKFSAFDSYYVGYYLFRQGLMFPAGFWLHTALQQFQEGDVFLVFKFNKLKIFELYAEVILRQNRYSDALDVTNIALKLEPNNAKLLRTKSLAKMGIDNRRITQADKPDISNIASPYIRGCRGEFSKRTSRLRCYHKTTTTSNAFLKFAPFKVEELYLDPYIVMFHNVLSDTEIAELKQLARPQLKRSTVYIKREKRNAFVHSRSSQFSWLGDNTNNLTKRLNQRISEMGGFIMNGSEMLQVMNYGLGGHYETHFDFLNISQDSEVTRLHGDRIATVLFYMTNVEQGGMTVFPNIQVAITPRKGSAVLWYNLNNKGEGDSRTLHAACPVIFGSKWVTNKWIRERNQSLCRRSHN